jgi:DNA-binding beta-propeller fold protein YncE
MVSVQLKSMQKKTFWIGCHAMSSTTFNVKNKTFGYMDCGDKYHIVDVEENVEVKQITLPESISLTVVDTLRNVLIGHYYNNTDHVLTINLADGSVVSNKSLGISSFWDATTCFFRDIENEYVLLRYDNTLVFINPPTGNITKTVKISTEAGNGVYDRKNNRLIGSYYSNETNKNHIVTIDINTGKTLSNVVAQGLGAHLAAEMDYDPETNCYVLVSADNRVLFFDVETGELKDSYQLDFDLVSLKLWRSNQ